MYRAKLVVQDPFQEPTCKASNPFGDDPLGWHMATRLSVGRDRKVRQSCCYLEASEP